MRAGGSSGWRRNRRAAISSVEAAQTASYLRLPRLKRLPPPGAAEQQHERGTSPAVIPLTECARVLLRARCSAGPRGRTDSSLRLDQPRCEPAAMGRAVAAGKRAVG